MSEEEKCPNLNLDASAEMYSNRLGNRMHELAGIGGLLLLLHSLQTVL